MRQVLRKPALLDLIDREQAFWNQLVAEIGPQRMTQHRATDAWTFKDVVAHPPHRPGQPISAQKMIRRRSTTGSAKPVASSRSRRCSRPTTSRFSGCATP